LAGVILNKNVYEEWIHDLQYSEEEDEGKDSGTD
jgi:hypothetical protein